MPPADWIAAFLAAQREWLAKAAEAENKQAQARAAGSKPSLDLGGYAGEYIDPWYGKAAIRLENGRLVLSMSHTPSMVGDLDHWQYDTFQARWRDNNSPDAFVTFTLNYQGRVEQVTMVAVSTLADFSFDYQDLLFRPVSGQRR